ncbi:hypothetical protein PGT21_005011 [Puccinia graminis f. sp. tritici]|uniref:Uncharacterized protein n=2 Tax=Puccinia graminis f. sp. tritici TaxID=56615 RepID=A0A5B0MDI1_PUCGR|nr:hypothetical protein PGTUg99_031194 [Puccinia graminis f. sp. tritici]KAA1090554.1 hypothetical protein PGT21_005011 [Puccinia graminis f. sp. tritici]
MPLNLSYLSVVLLLGFFSVIETRAIAKTTRQHVSEYVRQAEQSFPVDEEYYQYPATNEAFTEEYPVYQTSRSIVTDDMPPDFLSAFKPYLMSDIPLQRASMADEGSGSQAMPSQFASSESRVEDNSSPKLVAPTTAVKAKKPKPATPTPTQTRDAEPAPQTFDSPRVEKAAMAAMQPLGSISRAQTNGLLSAPLNLLSGKEAIPDFGFVNNKNIDGQLRKVTYGVDDKGNIVEHSAQVVNS